MNIDIEGFYGVPGISPYNAKGIDGVYYSAWDLNKAAEFMFTITTDYDTDDSVDILLSEASVSASLNHKWQTTVQVNEGTKVVTTTAVTSSATSLTKAITTITLLNPHDAAVGDLIAVEVRRIAAASSEDPLPIRLFSSMIASSDYTLDYTGRVSDIIHRFQFLSNDEDQEFVTNSEALKWINQCQLEISRMGYWEKQDTIDSVADQENYDLATLLPGFIFLKSVRWNDPSVWNRGKIERVNNRAQYERLKEDSAYSSLNTGPRYYWCKSSQMYLCPAPTSTATDIIKIDYTYKPDDLDGRTLDTPELPEAFDDIFVNFMIRQAMARDWTRSWAPDNFKRADAMYRELLGDLMWQNRKGGPSGLQPYR